MSVGYQSKDGVELLISGSRYQSAGQNLFYKEFDDPSTNGGYARHCDYDRNYTSFAKLSYRDLTLEGAFSSRTKGIPTASFETDFNEERNRTTDERGYVDLRYEHHFKNNLKLLSRLFYDSYNYEAGIYIQV